MDINLVIFLLRFYQRGKINFHEFKYGLENLHIRITEEQIHKIFKILDKVLVIYLFYQNKDGFINFPEFSLLSKGNLKDILNTTNVLN